MRNTLALGMSSWNNQYLCIKTNKDMKTLNKSLWGLFVIALGVCLLLHEIHVIEYNIFFDGWWTIFLIVPGVIGVLTQRHKFVSLIPLTIGVILLLGHLNIIKLCVAHHLILPSVLIILGLQFVYRACVKNSTCPFEPSKSTDNYDKGAHLSAMSSSEYDGKRDYAVLFSGQDIDMSNQFFQGANMKAMFGGFKLDLRNAVIEQNATVNVQCLFGGVEMFVPENINVILTNNCICGGVDLNDRKNPGEGHNNLYINASCIFGGVDVK